MAKSSNSKPDQMPDRAAYLKSMLDNIADPIFVKDREHRWVDGNTAFWELMGGTAEKFIGKTDYDFFSKEESDVFWKKDDEVFESGEPVINEEFLTDPKGIRHTISTKKTIFLNEKGERVLVGIIRDITAEKELEDLRLELSKNELTKQERQLAQLSERTERQWRFYDTALSNTADFNYIFDLEGRFIYMNKALLDLWQKTFHEVVNKNFFELGYPPELAERLQQQIQEVIRTKKTLKDEALYTGRQFEHIFRPVLRTDGSVEAVVGSTRDITELKEADRRKDEFLAMLAHELRNPLAPISNAAHVLKSASVSNDVRQEAAALVDRQVTQMTHLLNDLLDVSRVTLGKIELHPQLVTLSEIINRAAENTKPSMDEHHHKLTIDLPVKKIWLNADVTRLTQVFSNLLHNSAKYTQDGGHITISAVEEKPGVWIKIKDNGIGIATDMLPHVFDLFAQADSSMERSHGGLGIGLTLVKNLVEKHSGRVLVNSEGKGKGSEFAVYLPTEANHQAIISDTESSTEDSTVSYKVLVIDDNLASAKTLGWTLELLGHQVQLAHEGSEALRLAKEFLPKIVLLDIGLPGMNGYEVCKALKDIPELENTVMIAQTGWGQKEHRQRSVEVGFHHHLVKPIRMETLQQILDEI